MFLVKLVTLLYNETAGAEKTPRLLYCQTGDKMFPLRKSLLSSRYIRVKSVAITNGDSNNAECITDSP